MPPDSPRACVLYAHGRMALPPPPPVLTLACFAAPPPPLRDFLNEGLIYDVFQHDEKEYLR
jgi:hypothetical protein